MRKSKMIVLIVCLVLALLPLSVFGEPNAEGMLDENSTEQLIEIDETSSEMKVEVDNSPDEIIADVEKTVSKRIVNEEKTRRTNNSKHYLLEDGSYQAVISSGYVHYEDENGELQDINTSLVDEADVDLQIVPLSKDVAVEIKLKSKENKEKRKKNQVNRSETDYRALQVPFDVKLPKKFDRGYSIGKRKEKLKFIPVDAASVTGTVYGVNGLKYENAWIDTDVLLQINSSGVKEDIILKTPNAPSIFSFEVQGDLGSELNNEELSILPAWLIDAEGKTRDVPIELRTVGNKKYIDMKIDTSGLSYPIIVDPTVSIPIPYQDGFVRSNEPNSTSYSINMLQVRGHYDEITKYSYIKFDISMIPIGSSILDATMNLVHMGGSQVSTLQWIAAMRVQTDWTTSALTYNTQPLGGERITQIEIPVRPSAHTIRAFNITSAVNNWVSGAWQNHGVQLVTTSVSSNDLSFFDHAHGVGFAPSLTVNYTQAPNVPTSLTPGSTTATPTLTTTVTPTLTWTYSDPNSDPQGSYQVLMYNTTGTLINDSGRLYSGTASYTVPSAILSFGSTYNWRVRVWDNQGAASAYSSNVYISPNRQPFAPSSLTPGGTVLTPQIAIGTAPTLSWIFVDFDPGESQTAFQLVVKDSTLATIIHDTGWINSSQLNFTLPAGIVNRGVTYGWSVRVKDKKGVMSGYATNKFFKYNSLPVNQVTSYTDGQSVPDNILNFTWNYTDSNSHPQTKFQIQGSKDNWVSVSYNSGEISSALTSFTTTPLGQGEWDFRIKVLDGYEWSSWIYRSNLNLPNSFEPNDAYTQAFPIQYALSYSSLISSATDVDFYKFVATSSGIDRITLNVPSGKNYDMYIYDSSMNVLATGTKLTGTEDILLYVQYGKTYYVRLFGANADFSTNTYTLLVNHFGNTNGTFVTDYYYDNNGNLYNKETITE